MKTSIIVQNLKCNGCANTITNKLSSLDNISEIKVDVDKSEVTFNYQNDTDVALVKATLKNNGYPEAGEENPLVTKAKSYVSCAIGKF